VYLLQEARPMMGLSICPSGDRWFFSFYPWRCSAEAVVGARSYRQPDGTLLSKFLCSLGTPIHHPRSSLWHFSYSAGCPIATRIADYTFGHQVGALSVFWWALQMRSSVLNAEVFQSRYNQRCRSATADVCCARCTLLQIASGARTVLARQRLAAKAKYSPSRILS